MTARTHTLFDLAGGRPAIEHLVRTFYDRARQDPRLAPVFVEAAGSHLEGWWAQHIEKLVDFWALVSGGPSPYRGQPAPAHLGFGIEAAHFDRWLELWHEALLETMPPEAAEDFYRRAARMRGHLERFLGQQAEFDLESGPRPFTAKGDPL